LIEEFSKKDLNPAKKILGMRISRKRKETVESITYRVREEGDEEV